jgi:hypothetical protein
MPPDPRSHRTYRTAAQAYITAAPDVIPCALCGHPLNTRLPGTHKWGATIEHRTPIRIILATARTNAEALAMACDTSQWGIAHRHCQSHQGGATTRERRTQRPRPTASRDW